MSSPRGYVPNTMASAAKYFEKGRYENVLLFSLEKVTDLPIGIKLTTSATSYWTVIDNFRLYYYGSMSEDTVMDITNTEVDNTETNTAVYNLHGQKVSDSLDTLPRGLYISGGKKIWIK
jgi:penicillin V acylase-like amidase (Ntn superfamily)